MAALTALLNTILTQTPPSGGTSTGIRGDRKNATKECKPDPKTQKYGLCGKMVRHKDADLCTNKKNASTRPSW